MIMHSIEECEQWLVYRQWYPLMNKVYMFEPKVDGYTIASEHVVDIPKKGYQHDIDRVKRAFDAVVTNYPKLEPLIKGLHVFMCPKPHVGTANACASSDLIIYYARGTQIPYCMTDYITAHELGHVVYDNLCDRVKFVKEYMKLRLPDKTEEERDSILRNRTNVDWHENALEWFAEDFRYLFGIDQGDKFWGMPDIGAPDERIREYMLSLGD